MIPLGDIVIFTLGMTFGMLMMTVSYRQGKRHGAQEVLLGMSQQAMEAMSSFMGRMLKHAEEEEEVKQPPC